MASTKIETSSATPATQSDEAVTEVTQSDATQESLTSDAFVALVVGLVSSATPTEEGTLTADQSAVNEAFRSVTQSDRNKARQALQAWVRTTMISLDVTDSRAVAILRGVMAAEGDLTAKAPKSTPAPVDPRPGMIQALVNLRAATVALEAEVGTMTDDESATEPDAESVDRLTKAALPKASRTYEGPRRSVEAFIKSAFEAVEVGTFLTVAQVRQHRTEAYGDDAPSAGAVAQRLHGAPIDGIEAVEAVEGQHPFGARRTA